MCVENALKLNCSDGCILEHSQHPQKNSGCISSHAPFQPPPSPTTPPDNHKSPLCLCLFWEFHINEVKHFVIFYVQLLSLSRAGSSFIHDRAGVSGSFYH